MTNIVLKGICDIFSWVISSREEPKASGTNNPKLAIVIEKLHASMEEHPEATTLLNLANALRKEFPDVEDLDTAQNAYDIIKTIQPPGHMKTLRDFSSELSDVSLHARTALEAEHGILSNLSVQRAHHVLREDDEEPNKLLALIEEIEKNPDAIEEDTRNAIFQAMDAIEDISINVVPSQDSFEALKYLTGNINSLVKQKYHTALENEDLINAAYDVYADEDIYTELYTLHANTANNFTSYFGKNEEEPKAKNKLYLAAVPQ